MRPPAITACQLVILQGFGFDDSHPALQLQIPLVGALEGDQEVHRLVPAGVVLIQDDAEVLQGK